MRSAFFLALLLAPTASHAQSMTLYLTEDCTYRSQKDGSTVTLLRNGGVKRDGKPQHGLRCENIDGTVSIYRGQKRVDALAWNVEDTDGSCMLKDDAGACYRMLSCTAKPRPH